MSGAKSADYHGSCSFLSIYLFWNVYFFLYAGIGTQLRRFGAKELFKKVFFLMWQWSFESVPEISLPPCIEGTLQQQGRRQRQGANISRTLKSAGGPENMELTGTEGTTTTVGRRQQQWNASKSREVYNSSNDAKTNQERQNRRRKHQEQKSIINNNGKRPQQ